MTFMETPRFRDYLKRRSRQTHCKFGHPLTPENTRTQVRKGRNGKEYVVRSCRACERERRKRAEADDKGPATGSSFHQQSRVPAAQ